MKILELHRWDLGPKEAIELQGELRSRIIERYEATRMSTVAGADIAIDPKSGEGIAAVMLFSYPGLEEIERVMIKAPITYPYVPGLLSFRECPVLLKAFERLSMVPDVVLFDGQGLAHPRGFGLASHMGLLLDIPAIGCAKSRLVGSYEDPPDVVGEWSELMYSARRGEAERIVGAVLRTRKGVRPLFISAGHKIDLATSIEVVMGCLDGTRIPKPTREADRLVGMARCCEEDAGSIV